MTSLCLSRQRSARRPCRGRDKRRVRWPACDPVRSRVNIGQVVDSGGRMLYHSTSVLQTKTGGVLSTPPASRASQEVPWRGLAMAVAHSTPRPWRRATRAHPTLLACAIPTGAAAPFSLSILHPRLPARSAWMGTVIRCISAVGGQTRAWDGHPRPDGLTGQGLTPARMDASTPSGPGKLSLSLCGGPGGGGSYPARQGAVAP